MRQSFILNLAPLAFLLFSCNPPCDDPYFCNEIIDRRYVHRYGITVPKHHWEDSGKDGQIITTLKQGIICKQNYFCGMLEGETTYTFPFCQEIEKIQVFSQDNMIKETVYYRSGKPRSEVIYNPSNHIVSREWYESGGLKCLEKRSSDMLVYAEYYDSRQQRVSGIELGKGIRSMCDNFGMLLFTDQFKDGEVEYRTTYYPNGTPKDVTPYVNGIVTGLRKTYYQGGEPNTIETWYQGKQDGITTVFLNGQREQEIPYVNGLRNGLGRLYKDGDIVVQEMTWKDDVLHGPCYTYIDNHTATEWYHKGKQVTKGYYDSFNFHAIHRGT